jgi:hypothetical protein
MDTEVIAMAIQKAKEHALKGLREWENALRTEIEQVTRELNADLERVRQLIRDASSSGDATTGVQADADKPGEDFAGLMPAAAVRKFFDDNPGREAFKPSQIAGFLKARGFTVNNPKLLTQQVLIACQREAIKGRAEETLIDGKKAFRAKAESEKTK